MPRKQSSYSRAAAGAVSRSRKTAPKPAAQPANTTRVVSRGTTTGRQPAVKGQPRVTVQRPAKSAQTRRVSVKNKPYVSVKRRK